MMIEAEADSYHSQYTNTRVKMLPENAFQAILRESFPAGKFSSRIVFSKVLLTS